MLINKAESAIFSSFLQVEFEQYLFDFEVAILYPSHKIAKNYIYQLPVFLIL